MKGGGSLGFTNSYENHVLYRLQCATFMLHLNHQCSFRVILFFIPLKTYLIAWKMRWVLLPDTNLNLRYKALDGFHLLVARAHIQVHFPRPESMNPQRKSLKIITCYSTKEHIFVSFSINEINGFQDETNI